MSARIDGKAPFAEVPSGDHMRILVVEDEPKTASFIRKALQAEAFAVDVLHNGEEALAAHRLEVRIDHVLRQRRVAAHVPLPPQVQLLRRHLAQHVAQVQVRLRDLAHVLAAHLAEVALFAARHDIGP